MSGWPGSEGMREDVSKRGVKATRRRHNVRGTCVRTGGRGGGGFAHVLADEDDTDIGVRVRPSVECRFDVRAVRFCGRVHGEDINRWVTNKDDGVRSWRKRSRCERQVVWDDGATGGERREGERETNGGYAATRRGGSSSRRRRRRGCRKGIDLCGLEGPSPAPSLCGTYSGQRPCSSPLSASCVPLRRGETPSQCPVFVRCKKRECCASVSGGT